MDKENNIKTILAIDDIDDNLVTISAVLTSFMPDCRVITAGSGREGIEKASAEQPDTIVLDVKMPGMDGYEACEILKSKYETRHIPVILLTAINTDIESRIRGLEIGADAFLTKPIDEAELIAQIKVMLRIKESEDLLRKEKDMLEEIVEERTRDLMASSEKLKRERDFLMGLSEASPAYFIALNEQGEVLNINRAFFEIIGYPDEEVLNKPIMDFIAPDQRNTVMATLEYMKEGILMNPFTLDVHTRAGNVRRVEWHGRVVYNPQKEIDFIFFVGIDITERIRLEQVIMENDEQERSRIGQDLHDGLGQHLAGIAFKSEILRLKFEEKLPEAQDDIREIVKLVNQAINQTRDLARGLCPVDRHGGGLEAALNDLASEVHEGHDINCIVTIDSTIEIESDITSTHLYYISREAVNNAIKHSGAKNIMINLERADDALVLSIIDDGIGISRDSEEGMGTGVGIMQYRTWLLGGSFSIGKNEGGGTVVIVTVKMEEHDIVREKETVLKEQINTSREEGVTRILIVDDHPIVRQGLIQILNMEEDLEVCGEARTADEAIRMTSNLEPHMLIIDLSLEGASGLDLLKAIRSRYPSLPVLVLSMYDEAIYGERTIQAGARGYVMKQEAPQTIVDAVRTVLQGRHYYSDTVRERILDSFHAYTGERSLSVSSLTNREFEVFQLLGHGMSNRTIAEKLNISIKTIENYRERIKNKLNIPSSTELVQYAVQLVIDQSKKQ